MSLSSSSFKPGDELIINKQIYYVQPSPDPIEKGKPYIEWGGNGQVLQLIKHPNQELYALKVFHKTNPRMLEYTDILNKNQISKIPGLAVAHRYIIESKKDNELTRQHPNLEYAVLMPWIKGNSWFEILVDNKNDKNIPGFNQSLSLVLAKQLAHVLMGLENRKLAHCDVCSNNIILYLRNPSVNLIDIEDMYLPGASRSQDFWGGQDGYRHPQRNDHQWLPESDRFGGGLLLSEILCWYSPIIKSMSCSESFFDQKELQTNIPKYKELKNTLGEQGDSKLTLLFDKLWYSNSLQECPKLEEWCSSVDALVEKKGIDASATGIHGDFGQDGRIRPRRKKVEFSTGNTTPTSAAGRKKVDLGTPHPTRPSTSSQRSTIPSFQKGTDWGQVIGIIFIIFVILGLCVGLAILINSIQHPTSPIPYPTITQAVAAIPTVISTTVAKYSPPTSTIAPINIIKPTSPPTYTSTNLLQPIPSNYKCPDKDQIELQVGIYGMVRKYDMNLRDEPVVPERSDANVIRVLKDGEKLKIIDGPRCSQGGTWWEVLSESGNKGWAREMLPGKGRLIIRINP